MPRVNATRRDINNLLINGDFEYVPTFTAATNTSGKFIDGTAAGSNSSTYKWIGCALNATRTVQFDTSVYYSGSASIKFTQTGTTTAFGIATSTANVASTTTPLTGNLLISVLPSTSYTISGWVKTNKVAGGGSEGILIRVWEYDSLNSTSYNGNSRDTSSINGISDWTQVSTTFTTAATTKAVNIIVQFTSTDSASTAWVDDVVFGQTTPMTRLSA
jgi:hypothetical protein